MLNFTVGPVMSPEYVIEVANQSTPYFRTPEFSRIMLENERLFLKFLNAPEGSRGVFLTTSGTGAMESCVMNVLKEDDQVIVINGGGFGKRFVELCDLHGRNHTTVNCSFGSQLKENQLRGLEGHSALLVNMDETSSGLLYDMKMISDYCKENDILLIVDAISSFLADEVDMTELGAAVIITGSQRALAVQPGVSLIALSPAALNRVRDNKEKCMYLSLKDALRNGERGQTPFTPAVTTLMQLHARFKLLDNKGGSKAEQQHVAETARHFRDLVKDLPLEMVPENPSNAVTTLHPLHARATEVVRILKDEYDIWVCPNGGEMSDVVFRVGHIGHITKADNECLSNALHDMHNRGLL